MIVRPGSSAEVMLPLMGGLVGISTIVLVYVFTKNAGHLPEGALTPPISLLGCNHPEHIVYQVGFFLTGTLLLGAIEQWRSRFYASLNAFGYWTRSAMLLGGYMAVAGVVGQGVVTLEEDLLVKIKAGQGLSRQSILHQQLAGIFFLGAALHCYATTFYILSITWSSSGSSQKASTNNSSQTPTKGGQEESKSDSSVATCCYGFWSRRLKLLCVATSLLAWPIAEGLHPARTSSLDKRNLNIAGMAQYIAVASYIAFFGSYTMDFASMRQTSESQSKHKPTKQS